MFKFDKFFMFVFLLGVVDQIQDTSVSVELKNSSGEVQNLDLPAWVFPCEIGEGDLFYIEQNNENTIIRCGELPR